MAASDAHDHPAMLRRLFSSCFHKRSGRLPSKSPHIDGAVETDSSHLTLEPLQSTTHAAQSPQNQIKTSIIGDAEGPIQSGLNSGNQQHLTMPKAAKEKSSRKAARAANDRRPYPRAQRPPRNSSYGSKTVGKHGEAGTSESDIYSKLNSMFDSFFPRQVAKDACSQPQPKLPDVLGPDLFRNYIESVGASLSNFDAFVVLDIVRAETVGEITRDGFVQGWLEKGVAADPSAHKVFVRSRANSVAADPDYFKRLYQLGFRLGSGPQQKSIDMGVALEFWGALFQPTLRSWRSAHVDWLGAWKQYLTGKFGVVKLDEDGEIADVEWTRTVSKDLWNQLPRFAAKTLQDETLSFWSEEQAWPALIDEFVVWCRDRGIVETEKGGGMEVDK